MIEQTSRLYHCHKMREHIHIEEDYDTIDGVRTLVRCSCPKYTDKPSPGYCDGMNEFGFRCSYSAFPNPDTQ